MKKYNEENREKIAERRKDWYQRTKETRIVNHKKYYQENYLVAYLSGMKRRAKSKGLEFDLTVDDLKFPETCPVFGFKLERGDGCVKYNSPSVDRIDPTKGYTRDNIQFMSHKANAMKNNATQEELELFAKWVMKGKKLDY